MDNPLTSLMFLLLTLLTLVACVLAWRRLRHPEAHPTAGAAQHWLVAIATVGSAAIFLLRWFVLHGQWKPVAAHVDGLALIGAMLGAAILYIQSRPRLFGLSAFALPMLALVHAWGICAAAWTYQPFNLDTLDPLWQMLHLVGVYLGTASAAVAAITGGMFLYIQHRLKHKHHLSSFGHLASLEALESLIVRTATLGFVLLGLGLATGAVLLVERPEPLAPTWAYALKIALALSAWLAYAIVMNVRHASHFRGARAAWLAIGGLVLLLVTYGLVTAIDTQPNVQASNSKTEPHTLNPEHHAHRFPGH